MMKPRQVDSADQQPEIFLGNLEEDMGETTNLADRHPDVTAELKALAEQWRAGIERRWVEEFGAPSEEQRIVGFSGSQDIYRSGTLRGSKTHY